MYALLTKKLLYWLQKNSRWGKLKKKLKKWPHQSSPKQASGHQIPKSPSKKEVIQPAYEPPRNVQLTYQHLRNLTNGYQPKSDGPWKHVSPAN